MRAVLLIVPMLVLGCDKKEEAKATSSEATPSAKPAQAPSAPAEPAKAPRAAAAAGSSSCEQAYAEMKQLIETFRGVPGNQAMPKVPEKEAYLDACAQLPPAMQECMRMSVQMKKDAECKKEFDSLPPKVKKAAKVLMDQAVAKGK